MNFYAIKHKFIFTHTHIIRRFFNTINLRASLWYFCACIYLLVSSCQIRRGYRKFTIKKFYEIKYSYWDLIKYYLYTYIPFLHIIKTTIDWMSTETALQLGHFILVEDIYLLSIVSKIWREKAKVFLKFSFNNL